MEPPGSDDYPEIWRDIFPFFAIIGSWINSRRYERAKRISEEVAEAERGLTAQTGVAEPTDLAIG